LKLTLPQKAILQSKQSINIFLAGQGSGKTHSMSVISSFFITNFPKALGLIAANTYSQLNAATLKTIREIWTKNLGLIEYNQYNTQGNYVIGVIPPAHWKKNHTFKDYSRVISFKNGAAVLTGSLDNYKALDGITNAWTLLDETKDTKEVAIKEVVIGRLRQEVMYHDKKGVLNDKGQGIPFMPLFMFTSPAKLEWINEWFELDKFEHEIKEKIFQEDDFFCKDHNGKRVVISSTFHNKQNLPSNYIQNQFQRLNPDLQEMLIYGSPFSRSGGEFYKYFSRDQHVKELQYNSDLPLHISFDENVNPYITLTIWQLQGKRAMQIDEICLENPRNSLSALCLEFEKRYYNHQAGLFIYGDRTSKKEDTKLEKGQNFFTLALSYLSKFHPSLRIPTINPSVVMRGSWINTIFSNQIDGISIEIDRNCTNTISDYMYLKEAADGRKEKKKVKDETTGISYEKYGHASDCNDYFLTYAYNESYDRFLNGGQEVEFYVYDDGKVL